VIRDPGVYVVRQNFDAGIMVTGGNTCR